MRMFVHITTSIQKIRQRSNYTVLTSKNELSFLFRNLNSVKIYSENNYFCGYILTLLYTMTLFEKLTMNTLKFQILLGKQRFLSVDCLGLV